MRHSLLIAAGAIAALIAICGGGPLQARTSDPHFLAKSIASDSMPEKVVYLADGVRLSADLTYSTIPGYRPLTLDLYRPAPGDKPVPLIMLLDVPVPVSEALCRKLTS